MVGCAHVDGVAGEPDPVSLLRLQQPQAALLVGVGAGEVLGLQHAAVAQGQVGAAEAAPGGGGGGRVWVVGGVEATHLLGTDRKKREKLGSQEIVSDPKKKIAVQCCHLMPDLPALEGGGRGRRGVSSCWSTRAAATAASAPETRTTVEVGAGESKSVTMASRMPTETKMGEKQNPCDIPTNVASVNLVMACANVGWDVMWWWGVGRGEEEKKKNAHLCAFFSTDRVFFFNHIKFNINPVILSFFLQPSFHSFSLLPSPFFLLGNLRIISLSFSLSSLSLSLFLSIFSLQLQDGGRERRNLWDRRAEHGTNMYSIVVQSKISTNRPLWLICISFSNLLYLPG